MEERIEELAIEERNESEEDSLMRIAAMAAEMAAEKAIEWAGLQKPPEDERMTLTRSLIEQEDELKKTEPDFALQEMMDTSKAFRALVMAGESVARALEYVRPERAQKRLEEEVMARVRKRNLRPQGIGEQNKPAEKTAEERLTEAEMRRIDAQLKRGQKVYLK